MKKALALVLAVLMLSVCFVGCSKDEEGFAVDEKNAVEFVQTNFSEEELGLDKLDKEYSLMVHNDSDTTIDDKEYIEVSANVVTMKVGVTGDDGKQIYSIETIRSYLVAKDGTKVLIKNSDSSDDYTELTVKRTDNAQKESNSEK